MAGEWVKRKIGSLGRVVTGKTPPTADSSNFGGPYPFITIPDLDGRVLIDRTERTLSEKGAEILRSCLLPAGSVMMSCIATVGRCGITTRPSFTNQQINSVIPNDEVDSRFLYYVFTRLGHELEFAGAGGSVYTNVSKNRFSGIEVVLPADLNEQRAIAHILCTLDDKIELSRQMSETLEAMVRALFKAWFVDFEPVRAKMEGRWQHDNPLLPLPEGEGRGEGSLPTKSHARLPSDLLAFARELRQNETDAERLLWRLLRNRSLAGAKFRRQHPFPPYVLDFFCHELKLAIELDGGQHNLPEGRLHDKVRTAKLAEHGIRVLRFWNHEVLRDTESVLEAIYQAIVERREELRPSPPAPLPAGEGSMVSGLPAHLYDLFPDRLVDSELGEIPEGWRVGTLAEIVELVRDHVNPLSEPASGFLHFSIPAFDEGRWPKLERGEEIKSQKWQVPPEVILLSKLNPEIERVWLVDVKPDDRAVCSTEFLVLRPKAPYGRAYVYCLTRSPLFRQQIEGLVTGTSKSHQRAQPSAILELATIKPSAPVVTAFDRAAASLLDRSLECRRESRTLAALRDALLPKLISGELRVKDVERFLEKASS